MKVSRLLLAILIPFAAACGDLTGPVLSPDAPSNLSYELIPSGDPSAPAGVLLTWDVPPSGRANSFNVYGRSGTAGAWNLRATTTSPTFHDAGIPQTQYYVSTRDESGNDLGQSDIITIDLGPRLPAPLGLLSTSLNSAIQLYWSSNAVDAAHGTFDRYYVYSTAYDGTRGVCTANWVVEGTTVTDGFFVGNLTNGVSRCFAVSAVTRDGHESPWSGSRLDTPRADARNAFVYSTTARADSSGFLFSDDVAGKLGVVGGASRTDLDISVQRHADGTLWFAPARSAVSIALYSAQPVGDLTSIDRAPSSGFANVTVEAVPGYAYVFRIQKPDGVHFAAIRVAFVTSDYVVFDWSYQKAPGNPELSKMPLALTH
jgi:hypothetical protein